MIVPPRPEDDHFMAEALRLAARLPRRPWPNPPVGALVVREGRVVGQGAHGGAGLPHAEALALAEAGEAAGGATLYLTLDPCNHHGRTPPCAPLVARSGVRRLVCAMADPNPTVPGGGFALAQAAGIDLTLGVRGAEALELAWPFVASGAFERPYVLLKTAVTLDGRFTLPPAAAGAAEAGRYLTGLAARRDVHRQRRWSDIVLVGERTVAADRPLLDGRLVDDDEDCPAGEPLAGYVDTDLSFSDVWPQERYYVFVGRRAAAADRRARIEREGGVVIPCEERDGHVAPESLLAEVFSRGGWCVMVEGGPTLAAAFLGAGLVDRWVQYLAPRFAGGGVGWPDGPAPAAAPDFQLTSVERFGPDLRVVHDRLPFAQLLGEVTEETAAGLRAKAGGS